MKGSHQIACLASALTLALAATAHAGWSAPTTVVRFASEGPTLATSASHGAIVAWLGQDPLGIRARRLGPNGRPGALMQVSDTRETWQGAPMVGVADSGAAVIAWVRDDADDTSTLLARRVTARGRLRPIRTLARYRSIGDDVIQLHTQLVVDGAGNATVVWNRVLGYPAVPKGYHVTEATLHVRRFNADGSLDPVVDIPAEGGLDGSPQLAVEPSGKAVLAWVRRAAGLFGVRASMISRDGRLGASHEIATPGQYWSGNPARVALDRAGRATITWLAPSGAGYGVAARQLSAQGPGPLHELAPPSVSVYGAHVAVTEDGTATVGWRQAGSPPDFPDSIRARQIRPNGSLGAPRTLSAPAAAVSEPQLAADGLGRTTVVWQQSSFAPGTVSSVHARAFGRAGRLGATHTLSPGERRESIGHLRVIADARGIVTAAWRVWGVRAEHHRRSAIRPSEALIRARRLPAARRGTPA